MRIFITGATGFIGTHLCHRLVADGHEVIALVRNPQKARDLPTENLHQLKGDLSIFKDPELLLPPCDQVIHLAGLVAADRLEDYREINFTAVQNLLTCLKRQRWQPKRFLFASSLAANGPSDSSRPHVETDQEQPNEPYGQSKLDAERYLRTYAPFPVTSFRPGAVYGPGDPALLTIFKMAARGFGFRITGFNQLISYIYVDDLVDAIASLLGDTSSQHRIYFTTHPENANLDQMWNELSRVMERHIFMVPIPKAIFFALMLGSTAAAKLLRYHNQLDYKQYQQVTVPAFACSSAALQRDFAWQPKYNLARCIEATTAGYREAGWL